MTRGWVGAPNGRAPFRFHGAVVGFVHRVCRGLGISPLRTNIWLSFSQKLFFSGFLKTLKLFWSKIGAHSERYRNLLAGIFETLTFNGNIAFLLPPVLRPKYPKKYKNTNIWRKKGKQKAFANRSAGALKHGKFSGPLKNGVDSWIFVR